MFIWSQSTDETVLHASHANTERATTTTANTTTNPMGGDVCEAEDNKKVFPDTQIQNYMPADICPPNSTFEDDELEALVSAFYRLARCIDLPLIRLFHLGQMHPNCPPSMDPPRENPSH